MNVRNYNRDAWDRQVEDKNIWTVPVSSEAITEARHGRWEIFLTLTKPVPQSWFPNLAGCELLCLASGGGQQGPILSAAGARVTVFDNSPKQLEQDRFVAEREALDLLTIEGDMADLSMFPDSNFDLIVNPASNLFVPDIIPVWQEAYRVLRPGGILMSGFMNPVEYIFDIHRLDNEGVLEVKHPAPFSGLTSVTDEERERYFGLDAPIEFGHTLADQIGGQLAAGFMLTGFYEDYRQDDPVGRYFPSLFATRAIKI